MVKISTPVLISLLAATAAAADLRKAHRGLHRRGNTEKPAPYPTTFTMATYTAPKPSENPSTYPSGGQPPKDTTQASDTTCTDESTSPAPESTKPYSTSTAPKPETQTTKSYPHSYPHSSPPAETTEKTKSYPSSTVPAESTESTKSYPHSYPHSSPPAETSETTKSYPSSTPPAESSETTKSYPHSSPPAESTTPAESTSCTEESTPPAESTTPSKSYPHSSPPAETTTPSESYPHSSPPAETTTPSESYPHSSPPAESTTPSESYPHSSPPAESTTPAQSYPHGTPPAGETSTTWETSTSVHYETVPASGHPYPSKPAPSECGTVTITVTEGQGHPTYSAMPEAPKPAAPKPEAPKPKPAAPVNSYSKVAPASYKTTPKPKPESNDSVGKRGIAYATIATLNVGSATALNWAHNWGASPTGLPQGIEYVPQCKDKSMVSEFQQNAGKASHLMSFNEVDMVAGGGGAPMSPQEAAAAYKEVMMPYAGTHKLGAPSVTSHDAEGDVLNGVSSGSGMYYLKQFAQACDGCQVDFACLHWYGGAGEDAGSQAEAFKTYVQQAVSTVQGLWPGCKVWITEFSALPTIDKDTSGVNKQFMEQVLPWLDSNESIDRYSYFAAIPGNMANADGSLTEIGQTYAS